MNDEGALYNVAARAENAASTAELCRTLADLLEQAKRRLWNEIRERERIAGELTRNLMDADRARLALLSALEDARRAEGELRARNRELELLQEIAEDLAAFGADVASVLVEALQALTDGAAVACALFDASGPHARVYAELLDPALAWRASRGSNDALPTWNLKEERRSSLVEQPLGQVLRLDGADADDLPPGWWDPAGGHGEVDRVFRLPFLLGQDLLGVAWVGLRQGSKLPSPSLLRAFSGMAALSLQRRRAEEGLRQSEAKFFRAFQMAPYGISLTLVENGRFVDVNEAFTTQTGWTREEALASDTLALGLWANRSQRDALLASLIAGKAVNGLECRFLARDGREILALFSARLIEIDGRSHVLATVADISGRKQAEAERDRLVTAIAQAEEMIVTTDAEARITYVNPAWERATGWRVEEATGQNPRILKSGEQDAAFYASMWATLRAGRTWRGRLVNRRKDGSTYTEECTISPVRDADGLITSYVAVKRDVTAPMEMEARLQQAQKMDSIGRLAGGIAHDFNNLLSVIQAYADFAIEGLDPSHPARADVLEIHAASERAAGLTRQLLAFGRKQILQPRRFVLNGGIESLSGMLDRILGEDVNLGLDLDPALWSVRADPGQFEQVVMNLAANARDAMPGGGRLTLSTRNTRFLEGEPSPSANLGAGDYVTLTVSDTGMGMDRDTTARIFEPFFTTKERGKGTGLGLATVHGIIRQSGGDVTLTSEPGKGATFSVFLPRDLSCEETEPAHASPSSSRPTSRGQETLLLVEDEPALLHVTRVMLEGRGYHVLTASSGPEALEIASNYTGEIHLLLSDVVMPGMSGKELAGRLRTTRPALRVLFMSGYTDDVIAYHGVIEPGIDFLGKPFTGETLAARLRGVLDENPGEAMGPPEGTKGPTIPAPAPQLDPARWAALPPDKVSALRDAVTTARYEEMLDIARSLVPMDGLLAENLLHMIERFDYQGLRDALGLNRRP